MIQSIFSLLMYCRVNRLIVQNVRIFMRMQWQRQWQQVSNIVCVAKCHTATCMRYAPLVRTLVSLQVKGERRSRFTPEAFCLKTSSCLTFIKTIGSQFWLKSHIDNWSPCNTSKYRKSAIVFHKVNITNAQPSPSISTWQGCTLLTKTHPFESSGKSGYMCIHPSKHQIKPSSHPAIQLNK